MTWEIFGPEQTYDPEQIRKELEKYDSSDFCNKIFAEHRELVPFDEVEKLLKNKSIELLTDKDKSEENLKLAKLIEKIIFENLEKNSEKIEHFKTCPNYSSNNKKLDFSNEKYIFTKLLADNVLIFHYMEKTVNKKNIFSMCRNMLNQILSFFYGMEISVERPSIGFIYLSLKWYAADTKTKFDSKTAKLIEEYEKKLETLTAHKYTLDGKEIKHGDSKK